MSNQKIVMPEKSQIDNRRIAKNTVLLYVRTMFVMVIALYTSRVILQVLGVEDYGVYQVIGGLVAMFSVITNALSSAISRFITYEIGKGDKEKLRKIFSSSLLIQLLISAVFILIAESVGGWFLHYKMQIPDGRMFAAEWVLHCSLITFCINLISVPYNACIIAHEHMKAFAYVSVLDAVLKLLICYLITQSPIDRLISYAILLTLISLCIRFIYAHYCHRHFEETRGKLIFDRGVFKDISGFAGWNFFTNTASVFNNQGVNMLINVFFGVTVNAARGIALQVEHAMTQFVNNFTVAINPQITKSYAAGEKDAMYTLVCRGAKFSFLAMLFFSVPIIFETETMLNLWLVKVPAHTVSFVRLSLVLGMLDCLGRSCYTACLATGKMRRYAMLYTPTAILEFPLTWIAFSMGAGVIWAYYLYVIVKGLCLCVRLVLIKDLLGFNPWVFVRNVYGRIFPVTAFSIVPILLLCSSMTASNLRLVLSIIVGCASVAVSSFFVGMTRGERVAVANKILSKVKLNKN